MKKLWPAVLATFAAVLVMSMLAIPTANANGNDNDCDADDPAPATQIAFTSISTPGVTLPDTAGSGNGTLVYIAAGTPFTVQLSLEDSTGTAAFQCPYHAGSISLSATNGPDAGVLATMALPAGATTATFTGVTLGHGANGVVLAATATASDSSTISGSSAPFDVLSAAQSFAQGTPVSSIGGTTTSNGCDATPADPVCGTLLLPSGASDSDIFLSQGVCSGLSDCSGSFIQAILSLNTDRQHPATLVMTCDKSLCQGGSIKSYHLVVNLGPGLGDETAPACPSKGAVGAGQQFCVDYVQSHRSNAGDTLLYLLFVNDAKIRFP
ncbi:MAG: hypothetical protein ACRDPI_07785 [Nocardioidaceae bacterium]